MAKKGFTLIELLIVVAIIAILAAIAVPNFLEAQVRSKVSRARADMRSIAVALEAYALDKNKYPPDGIDPNDDLDTWHLPYHLTTPVAYITTVDAMIDPFNVTETTNATRTYRYINLDCTWGTKFHRTTKSSFYSVLANEYLGQWALLSDGPDKRFGPAGANVQCPPAPPEFCSASWKPEAGYPGWPIPYDPTNGTVSLGDIQRTHLNPESAGNDS
ncbi:MAG: hypothetical protein Kow0059_10160 [Candidatus Sumerlaeia bacterium]